MQSTIREPQSHQTIPFTRGPLGIQRHSRLSRDHLWTFFLRTETQFLRRQFKTPTSGRYFYNSFKQMFIKQGFTEKSLHSKDKPVQTLKKTVGSQFSNFFKTPEKILRCVSSQLNTCTTIQKFRKPNIRGCLNVQIGLGKQAGAQLVTLSYSPKFQSQMCINRSCIQHIALDTLVRLGLIRLVQVLIN